MAPILLSRREREIYDFLERHLEVRVFRYAVPDGPTVQLVLCGEVISEASIGDEEDQ